MHTLRLRSGQALHAESQFDDNDEDDDESDWATMSEFWLRMLGFDLSRIPKGAATEFTWTHAPSSWGVFVLLALVAGLVYLVWSLYRRELTACPRRVKSILAAIRILPSSWGRRSPYRCGGPSSLTSSSSWTNRSR